MSPGREKIAKFGQFPETDEGLHATRVEVSAGRRGLPLRAPGLPSGACPTRVRPLPALWSWPPSVPLPQATCLPGHSCPLPASSGAAQPLCAPPGCKYLLRAPAEKQQWAKAEEILFPQ